MSYPQKSIHESYILYEEKSEEAPPSFPEDANPVESDVTAEFKNPVTDHLIHAKLNLTQEEKNQGAKVIGCKKDPNGDTFGKYNDNPLFKSILYYIEFPDG